MHCEVMLRHTVKQLTSNTSNRHGSSFVTMTQHLMHDFDYTGVLPGSESSEFVHINTSKRLIYCHAVVLPSASSACKQLRPFIGFGNKLVVAKAYTQHIVYSAAKFAAGK